VLDAAGGLVRSATQVAPGDQLTTRLADGSFISRVESAAPHEGYGLQPGIDSTEIECGL
jgi:exonuclease VII large subunit